MKDMEIGPRFQGACEIYPDKNWLLFSPFGGGEGGFPGFLY
jgi:hypothetical protein